MLQLSAQLLGNFGWKEPSILTDDLPEGCIGGNLIVCLHFGWLEVIVLWRGKVGVGRQYKSYEVGQHKRVVIFESPLPDLRKLDYSDYLCVTRICTCENQRSIEGLHLYLVTTHVRRYSLHTSKFELKLEHSLHGGYSLTSSYQCSPRFETLKLGGEVRKALWWFASF